MNNSWLSPNTKLEWRPGPGEWIPSPLEGCISGEGVVGVKRHLVGKEEPSVAYKAQSFVIFCSRGHTVTLIAACIAASRTKDNKFSYVAKMSILHYLFLEK